MRIIKPPKLNIGDTVGIVSPSQPVTNRGYYQRSINALRRLGFQVVLGKNAYRSYGYMAGTAEERVADIHAMFTNPAVKAIFSSAGGFVSHHLLRYLDYDLIRANPKIFCGFSDVATLLNAFFKKSGLISFYNFSIEQFNRKASDFTIRSFMDFFVSDTPQLFLPQKSRWRILRRGRAEGRLIGGNLLTVAGNFPLEEYFPDPRQERRNYILFFEEHGTDFEELDNSLHRLGLAGILNQVEGIIIGKITDIDPAGRAQKPRASKDIEFRNRPRPRDLTLNQLLFSIFEEYDLRIPIVANVDFGYTRDKFTMPVGATISMNLNQDKPRIRFLENPLSK